MTGPWAFTRLIVGVAGLLTLTTGASALDPTRTIAQLRHSRWTLGDGAPGNIRAIAQGRDGYLWLGTATGLYRFDGLVFERIVPVDEDPYRSPQITALLAARNGDIWVGYDFGGVAVFRGGILKVANPSPPIGGVNRIVEGRDGAIWFAVESKGRLVLSRLSHGRWSRFGARQGVPDTAIGDILSTSRGIYVSARPRMLLLKPGGTRFIDAGIPSDTYGALAESPGGRLWQWNGDRIRPVTGEGSAFRSGPVTTPFVFPKPVFDRDGSLWLLGQDTGLGRLPAGSLDRSENRDPIQMFTEMQGLTASLTLSMLEDREGNIWVGTESGLDRFSPSNIVQPETTEALVSGFVGPTGGGPVFVAGLSGVFRIARDGKPVMIFRVADIGVLCGDSRRVLIVSMRGKWLLDIDRSGNLGKATPIRGPISITCALDTNGQFWTGADRVYRVVGDSLQSVGGAAGTAGSSVPRIRSDGAGGIVFARVFKGFARLKDGTETRLWRREDHVVGSTRTMVPSRHGLLIVGDQGLARYDGHRLASLTDRTYPFLVGLTGLIQTADGSTWVIGTTGIVRMATVALDAAFAHPGAPLPFERFGYQEDFRARSNMVDANDIAEDAAGRLWFATNKGLAMIDPRHVSRNRLPPTVQIRSLDSGGAAQTPGTRPVVFPAGTNHVRIRYTALSLTNATANRFRYRIEGIDRDWVDAGEAREALYTNLGPGTYRFRVIAANNDGVWNRDGAVLAFTIAPRFYQTYAFVALCIAAILILGWLLYRRRVRAIADRTRGRFEVQLAERERIARELHDTLLQGFQGLMLRFQSVVELLPRGDRARTSLEGVLERADDVLLDGRDRVRFLRDNLEPVALPALLTAITEDIVAPPLTWDLDVDGVLRPVYAPVADEIAQIVREALANTVRHAKADRIGVAIRSNSDKLVITVADNGRGLPSDVRESGHRPGHYGLIGMRERAVGMGGTFAIRSDTNSGTEISVTIPARIAYR
ncbi:sensor histidine kinase [Sphingomonas sp. Leaf205]|uniref:sensor histidine kinase n=1 Tax=Sphingomonas sp. Leaf205 TaxID=2876551 RepID=UPI001E3D80C9|nr:sensor histidine kinase [Sphingomonas sp. Leaf205]